MLTTTNNVRNPRTGLLDYTLPVITNTDVQNSCNNLKANQPAWNNSGIQARVAALQQWKIAVQKYKQQLINAIATDTGRMWETILEVDLVASSIDRWSAISEQLFTPPLTTNSSIPQIQLQQHLVPFALVGVISPWNFPLLLSLIDTIPALLAGCAVLVKPSEVTPRFVTVLQLTISEVPALQQVLQVIAGNGSVGAAMVQHCSLICFTGSTATGHKVYDAASKAMIPVFLELGGKDPAIVLQGANLENATSSILWGSTANAGQSCLSIERVYVQQPIFDEFLTLLVAKASTLKNNNDDINGGQIGPIIFEKQAHIINEQLTDAFAKGAKLLYGNEQCQILNGGYYCLPTILINVNHTMLVMQQETFGPIIPIMAFETIDDAVHLANDTVYGLSGAVFAATVEDATTLALRIEGGAISINECALTAIMHEGEKNSFKLSGIGGTRMGPNAIKRFMRQKVLLINNNEKGSGWWYKK